MRFNYRPAYAKAHACAVRLGCKKRIEDLIRLLRGQAHTRVADGHLKLLVFRSLRRDGQLSRPLYLLHRIDAVDHEVHQHLLQLHTVPHDLGKICGQFRPD